MSRRIVSALGALRPFIPQWRPFGNWRATTSSGQQRRRSSSDTCDGMLSIGQLLQEDERIELEKLLKEIDQFSEAFKNADRVRCER